MPAAESSLRITEAYRSRLFGIRSLLERRAESLWPTIDGLDDFTWTNKAAAATQNAQREAVALTGAYLTAFLSSEVGTRTRGPILDTRRYSGLSRDGRNLRDSLRSPMIGVRFKLKEGATPEEALAYGLNRAKRMVSVDYDHAHRTALLDGLAADERFAGWQRAVTGTCGACAGDIAVEVSTNLPSIPLQVHPNCQCVTEPVVTAKTPRGAGEAIAGQLRRWGRSTDEARLAEAADNWTDNLEGALFEGPEIRQALQAAIRENELSDDFQALIEKYAGGRDVVVIVDPEKLRGSTLLNFEAFTGGKRLGDVTFLNGRSMLAKGDNLDEFAGLLRHEFSHSLWDAVPAGVRQEATRRLGQLPKRASPFSDVEFLHEFTDYAAAARSPVEAFCEAVRVITSPRYNPADWSPEFQEFAKWLKENL
jgi:hypothetical protein